MYVFWQALEAGDGNTRLKLSVYSWLVLPVWAPYSSEAKIGETNHEQTLGSQPKFFKIFHDTCLKNLKTDQNT